MDSAEHDALCNLCDFLGTGGHSILKPFFQQTDAPGTDEGVVVFQLCFADAFKVFGVAFQIPLTARIQKPCGKLLIPVRPQGHNAQIGIVLEAVKDSGSDFEGSSFSFRFFQKGLKGLLEGFHHLCFHLLHEVIEVGIVGVKGTPVDAGGFAQFFYRNALNGLLAEQRGHGLANQKLCQPGTLVDLFHNTLLFMEITNASYSIIQMEKKINTVLQNKKFCTLLDWILEFAYNFVRNLKPCMEE